MGGISPQSLKNIPKKSKQLGNSLYTASLLTLTALNIADYVSTVKALQLPGLEEGNPIMRPFTKKILLFSAVKLGITALDFHLLKNIYKKNKTLGWILSIVGNIAMSYVVSNNIRKIQSVARQ
jgi:energy-converting hydrogenase Eha subunit A